MLHQPFCSMFGSIWIALSKILFYLFMFLACIIIGCSSPYTFPVDMQNHSANAALSNNPTIGNQSANNPLTIPPNLASLPDAPSSSTATKHIFNMPEPDPQTATKKAILSPGDVIHVDVVGEPELSKDFTVPADGIVYYPLIKTVNLLGKTVKEVTEELKEKLSRYLVGPIVNVSLVRWGERKVYLYIEKESSKVITLPTEEQMTVSRLLLSANLPSTVNLSEISIIRKDAQGQAQVHTFSLRNVLKEHNFKQDFIIQPDDIIVLKKSPMIYIQGNIVTPGGFAITENQFPTVWEALSLAGGPTLNADIANIKIFRKGTDEAPTTTTLTVNERTSTTTYVQPEDIIMVPPKPQQFVSIYGEVTRPGMIPLTNEHDRLSSVLARAGGLTEFASYKIEVYRRTQEGKIQKFLVNYEAITMGDLRHDLEMLPGDIIQVGASLW